MTIETEVREELGELTSQFSFLADLCRDPQKLAIFVMEYQRWYSRGLGMVSLMGPDRLQEFQGYYLAETRRRTIDSSSYTIQDYLLGVRPDPWVQMDIHRSVLTRLTAQLSILQSLEYRLESVLADVEGQILAELEDAELEAARKLLDTSPRAAGALATVVLKTHLLRTARNHGVKITTKNPTVPYLNEMLKKSKVYDLASWRSIELLNNLHKACMKKKADGPEPAIVEELISRVDAVVKTVV